MVITYVLLLHIWLHRSLLSRLVRIGKPRMRRLITPASVMLLLLLGTRMSHLSSVLLWIATPLGGTTPASTTGASPGASTSCTSTTVGLHWLLYRNKRQ